MNIIKERIEALLQRDKKSQIELANELRIDRNKMSRIMNGQDPSIEELNKMCEIFGCTSDYIIGRDSQPTRAQTDICNKTGLSGKAAGRLIDLHSIEATPVLNTISFLLEHSITDNEIRNGYTSRSLFSLIGSYLNFDNIQLSIDGKVAVAIDGLPSDEEEMYTVNELYSEKTYAAIKKKLDSLKEELHPKAKRKKQKYSVTVKIRIDNPDQKMVNDSAIAAEHIKERKVKHEKNKQCNSENNNSGET